MNYHAAYDMIVTLQEELAAQHHGCLDYKIIKALAATYELQEYLANRIAVIGDPEDDPYDAIIAQACREYEDARIAALPDPDECQHEFSPEFQAAMAKMIGDSENK